MRCAGNKDFLKSDSWLREEKQVTDVLEEASCVVAHKTLIDLSSLSNRCSIPTDIKRVVKAIGVFQRKVAITFFFFFFFEIWSHCSNARSQTLTQTVGVRTVRQWKDKGCETLQKKWSMRQPTDRSFSSYL